MPMKCPEPDSVMSISQDHCNPPVWQFFNAVRSDRLGLNPIQNLLMLFRSKHREGERLSESDESEPEPVADEIE